MCGIAGYIGTKQIEKYKIRNTLKLMINRGPDNQNWHKVVKENFNIFLLHSRLSIIDLDNRSNQPFIYEKYIIVFNGEIYNFVEIRKQLLRLGYKFSTNSDTEVLLMAYIEYGEMSEINYELFPEGSLYAQFGTFPIKTKKELESKTEKTKNKTKTKQENINKDDGDDVGVTLRSRWEHDGVNSGSIWDELWDLFGTTWGPTW